MSARNPHTDATYYAQHARFIVNWIHEVLADARRPVPTLELTMIKVINNAIQALMDSGYYDEHRDVISTKALELTQVLDAIWPGWPSSCLQHEVGWWGIEEPALVLPVEAC